MAYETKEYTLGSGHLHVELRDAATFDPGTYEWDKFFTSQTNLIGRIKGGAKFEYSTEKYYRLSCLDIERRTYLSYIKHLFFVGSDKQTVGRSAADVKSNEFFIYKFKLLRRKQRCEYMSYLMRSLMHGNFINCSKRISQSLSAQKTWHI